MTSSFLLNLLRVKPRPSIFLRWTHTQDKVVIHDPFANTLQKNKKTYMELVKIFEGQDTRRRGHVEFIYAALKQMEDFGVNKDLEVYKDLLDVLPKGRFIPQNIFQSEFMHYPKQQQCAVDLLEQMEDNGVMPDFEMEDILLNVFGRRGIPLRKFWRMMYWMPKFRNLSPWYLPTVLPGDTLELAKLAIERITSIDPDTIVEIFQAEEIEASLEKTWIVSAQSPAQKELLAAQPKGEPLVIRGPFIVHLRDQTVTYFTLIGVTRDHKLVYEDKDDVTNIRIPDMTSNPKLPAVVPTVHEQDDGTIVALCATGTSSRDSLLSWIRLLELNGNVVLGQIPVIFTLQAPLTGLTLTETQPTTQENENAR